MNPTVVIRRRGSPAAWLSASDLALYRGATVGLLRRYLRLSVEMGRLPSLLGREFFRTHLVSYRMQSFEDAAIFVHDLERCLEKMDDFSRQVLARIVFQEYTQEEAAVLLGCTAKTLMVHLAQALDHMSRLLLERCLLPLLPLHAASSTARPKSCQEGKSVEISASLCRERK